MPPSSGLSITPGAPGWDEAPHSFGWKEPRMVEGNPVPGSKQPDVADPPPPKTEIKNFDSYLV